MADFLTAFNYMIVNEDSTLSGVVVTDNDGGTTRLGLDSKSNPELLTNDFYTCPVAEAIVIAKTTYQAKYWAPIWGDKLLSQRVASKFLDMSVNENPSEAIKLTQRAAYGQASGVNIDGQMGPNTLKTINDDHEGALLQGMCTWWNWFIGKVIQSNPTYARYETSWRNRAFKLPA